MNSVRLTFIIENTSSCSTIGHEHGLAVLVERNNRQLLFDTGQSNLLAANAAKLNIDLDKIRTIVLSHGHYDHGGGLFLFRQSKPQIIIADKMALVPRYAVKFGEKAREIGIKMPKELIYKINKKPTEIIPGVIFLGIIPRYYDFEDSGGPFYLDPSGREDDLLLDDSALLIETADGPILLAGCAHSGICNIIRYAAEITGSKMFRAVLGGMHLLAADHNRLKNTLKIFHRYAVKDVGPCHCTGEPGCTALAAVYQKFLSCSAGTVLEF
jgi:7,8-dihydropterin-6-yl-methyl-4-(beta-D-ribofuranosyl)aminobenzene 5'-phosphate synthase